MLISVSTGSLEARFGTQKMFALMKEAGIDAADYGLDDWIGSIATVKKSRNYQMSEEETINYYTEIRKLADQAGVIIGQTHSMFGAKRIFDERDEIMKVMKNSILATHVLGSHYTVIHPIATEGRIFDEQKEKEIYERLSSEEKFEDYKLQRKEYAAMMNAKRNRGEV